MKWIEFPDERLNVNGLPWFGENAPEVWRLPKRMKDSVSPEVWNLALQPSGGRIRFSTDATSVAIRVRYPNLDGMDNMHKVGQMGFDLYVDGVYWSSVFPSEEANVEGLFYAEVSSKLRNVCIYMPLYHPVQILDIGVNDEANIWEPGPFSVRKPVAFYGTSITQGGCASRSGMSYQAILGRELLLDYVNLGFSGNGKGERELALATAEVDASCYVLDFGLNNQTPGEVEAVYGRFLDVLLDARPTIPIICVTPIYCSAERFDQKKRELNEGIRQVIRDAVRDRSAESERIGVVEGPRLIGPEDSDGLVDGVHPNDLGFQKIADGLGHAIFEVLKMVR